MASALTTSPCRASATATPRPDLPVAVGPTTATSGGGATVDTGARVAAREPVRLGAGEWPLARRARRSGTGPVAELFESRSGPGLHTTGGACGTRAPLRRGARLAAGRRRETTVSDQYPGPDQYPGEGIPDAAAEHDTSAAPQPDAPDPAASRPDPPA